MMKKILKLVLLGGLVSVTHIINFPVFADVVEFDGKWKANAHTESGPCKADYSFKLKFKEGIVTGKVRGKSGNYKLEGIITETGELEIELAGSDPGKFIGKVIDDSGDGSWLTGKCKGTFTIAR